MHCKERFHGSLDLGVADGRVAEEDTVMNQRADHIEDQADVDLITKIPSRLGSFQRLSDSRARGIEQSDHERVAQLAIAGAVDEQRPDHTGRQAPECGYEDLRALVEIAQRAARVRRSRLPESASERREHQPLATRPAAVDRGLGGARAPCHSSSVRPSDSPRL